MTLQLTMKRLAIELNCLANAFSLQNRRGLHPLFRWSVRNQSISLTSLAAVEHWHTGVEPCGSLETVWFS